MLLRTALGGFADFERAYNLARFRVRQHSPVTPLNAAGATNRFGGLSYVPRYRPPAHHTRAIFDDAENTISYGRHMPSTNTATTRTLRAAPAVRLSPNAHTYQLLRPPTWQHSSLAWQAHCCGTNLMRPATAYRWLTPPLAPRDCAGSSDVNSETLGPGEANRQVN